jgi:hypothetical protein
LSIIIGKHQSEAEKFLFYDCLLHEFILLYHGIHITIMGKNYFVQARIISHVFDLKGAECIFPTCIFGEYEKVSKPFMFRHFSPNPL